MSMIGAIVVIAVGGIISLVKYTEIGETIVNRISTYYADYGWFPFLIIFTLTGAAVISASCVKSIKTLESMDIQ